MRFGMSATSWICPKNLRMRFRLTVVPAIWNLASYLRLTRRSARWRFRRGAPGQPSDDARSPVSKPLSLRAPERPRAALPRHALGRHDGPKPKPGTVVSVLFGTAEPQLV